jgi:tryptophanyl-tRNA synthetase
VVDLAKGRILSGNRPTGKLHLGNFAGALANWVRLQEDYECFFMVADWHALTTGYDDTSELKEYTREMLIDWISAGLDPSKSVIFRQSDVKEHAELHLLLSMITPLGWLERCPTYKEQLQQLSGKEITNYGFLGYPVLMAADILVYKADTVPVGEDQLPHLELAREIARRFNYLYAPVLPEPQAKLSQVPLLPGVDGRKMSKSYGNTIALSDPPERVSELVNAMVTDPERIRKSDPGHPDICTVYAYYKGLAPEVIDTRREECEGGKIGCVACKRQLLKTLLDILGPIHERRRELASQPGLVESVLQQGAAKARPVAERTIVEVREAMRI